MSVLAHIFERAGLATVGISIVRGQAENARPPRMLHCQFPLGRPLGKPNDAEFQTAVLEAAFGLLDRTDVPVLEDYPVVIDDEAETPATCALPPRLDTTGNAAADEARGLRGAYDRNVEQYGRTAVGRIAEADGVPELLERVTRLEEGAPLEEVDLADGKLIAAGQDIRAYYEEAGLQLADVTGARQLETWFYDVTEAGQLLRRTQLILKAAEADQLSWQYMLPRTQAR